MSIVVFSKPLAKMQHIDALLGDEVVLKRFWNRHPQDCKAVAGWGLKRSGIKGRQYAESRGLPFLCIEDGFLRSFRLGSDGEAPLSVVVDRTGIYYDATQPSDLENMLNSSRSFDGDKEIAREAMGKIALYGLSKYNATRDFGDPLPEKGSAVLLIDQTLNDLSVESGMANEQSFATMLHEALHEYSRSDIYINFIRMY